MAAVVHGPLPHHTVLTVQPTDNYNDGLLMSAAPSLITGRWAYLITEYYCDSIVIGFSLQGS